eukprot:CAMPEP_0177625936 /NCGR_PEP_ID=MMETSP0419_2-20121207/30377_1 /TAXON_ID=582737 /ORGANISM="Tetraselmis sp., Strain GSL018" /LENGTH=214 /DNA_ID=CAMNT_0019126939 /DNA_START=60 /DNA_END=700 /DNA_ORIENTATION=+
MASKVRANSGTETTVSALRLPGVAPRRAPASRLQCSPVLTFPNSAGFSSSNQSVGTRKKFFLSQHRVKPRDASSRAVAQAKEDQLAIQPIKEISGEVLLPGSKSLSNRILLLAALADGTTVVENLLDSDDIRYMVGALKTLGVKLEEDWENCRMTVHGCAGRFPSEGAELFLGNAGTAMRPLTAAVAADFVLDGVPRMRERPIQDLVDGLTQLG